MRTCDTGLDCFDCPGCSTQLTSTLIIKKEIKMYKYEEMKNGLFTEEGQTKFLNIRDNVKKLLKQSGAVRMKEAINVETDDTWLLMACVDRMVEIKELKEITPEDTMGQNRVFVEGPRL